LPATGSIERTFDLDTLNKAAGVPGLDSSGSHWIAAGLESPLTLRDLLRESPVDLVTLAESVSNITVPALATKLPVDPTRIHYMGHSQGAIEGPGFLAAMGVLATVIPSSVLNLQTATLADPGGEYIYLAYESPTFAPQLIPVIEQHSGGLLTPGTTAFAIFERDGQSVIDAGDPWNYIAQAAAVYPIHMIQVVGLPGTAGCNANNPPHHCPDQVVPNDGTERLISAGGFTQEHVPGVPPPGGGKPLDVFVNFTDGVHASFLDPTFNKPLTEEMQFEAISFTGQAAPLFGLPATTPGTSLIVGAVDPADVQ